jgi:disulfide bond formation protein DsbB
MRSEAQANALVLLAGAGLIGGALAFQYLGGLAPCEMCYWQRWAVLSALALGLLAWAGKSAKWLVALSILALLGDAGLGVFHVGVEQHWWQGITRCAATPVVGDAATMMADIMAQPLVRCDAIPWSMAGISMAGWNAIVAGLAGMAGAWLLVRR